MLGGYVLGALLSPALVTVVRGDVDRHAAAENLLLCMRGAANGPRQGMVVSFFTPPASLSMVLDGS